MPARTLGPIAAGDAGRVFEDGPRALGRGRRHRDRGGHDLRAWLITSCQAQGVHCDRLRVVMHTAEGDIVSGYTCAT